MWIAVGELSTKRMAGVFGTAWERQKAGAKRIRHEMEVTQSLAQFG